MKLSKFHSEYDLQYLAEEIKSAPYLTFHDYASHPKKYDGIPYSIIEDDLPKIRPRHYSISNDPFGPGEISSANEFRLAFTVHKFNNGKSQRQEGFCTSFLRNLLNQNKLEQKFKV